MTVTSLSALAAGIQRTLNSQNSRVANNVNALVTGNRLVQASTDVAALSTAVGLQNQTTGLRAASLNIAQASSFLQVADGGAQQIGESLDRLNALAVQANNGALSDENRAQLNQEFQALRADINRTAQNTQFNGQRLLDGSLASGASPAQFQVGSESSDNFSVEVPDLSDAALFGTGNVDLLSQANAAAALNAVRGAQNIVTSARADIGAFQNALEFAQANVESAIANQEAARASLADTDFASASTESAQARVGQQASIALLAQSNRMPANILALLNE